MTRGGIYNLDLVTKASPLLVDRTITGDGEQIVECFVLFCVFLYLFLLYLFYLLIWCFAMETYGRPIGSVVSR